MKYDCWCPTKEIISIHFYKVDRLVKRQVELFLLQLSCKRYLKQVCFFIIWMVENNGVLEGNITRSISFVIWSGCVVISYFVRKKNILKNFNFLDLDSNQGSLHCPSALTARASEPIEKKPSAFTRLIFMGALVRYDQRYR